MVELQLADTLEGGFVCEDGVADAHTQVAQHGGVSEVTLPAGDGELGGEVFEEGVGDTEVAFAVFKVDWVDLVVVVVVVCGGGGERRMYE